MAYNKDAAQRVREVFESHPSCEHGSTEQYMFGGLCFLIRGNMCCGIIGEDLVLRLGKDGTVCALEEPNTRPMDFTGKVLSTMVYVELCAVEDSELEDWIYRGVDFAMTLSSK